MPGKKCYECVVCNKRTKPHERRCLDGDANKTLRTFLKNTFFIEIQDSDVLCNKCRQKYYYSLQDVTPACKRLSTDQDICDPDYHPRTSKIRRTSDVSPLNITLPLKSTGKSHSACFVCKRPGPKLINVPVKGRYDIFLLKSIIIPAGTRCCPLHVSDDGSFTVDAYTQIEQRDIGTIGTQFNRTGIVELIEDIRKIALQNINKRIDFDNTLSMKDEDFKNLTGLTKVQFDDLCSFSSSIRETRVRSVRTCIGLLLTKLRTGISNKLLSTLFNIAKSSIQKAISSARKDLMNNFTHKYIGFHHITRQEVIQKHTTHLAQSLFGTIDNNTAILVLDGTYIYIQKSSDYYFQRRSFSTHKQRPLVKPMLAVTTTGYIVSVLGPYLSDRKNNDASILTHAMKTNVEEITSWFKENDVMVVDRGFRDATDFLEDLGIHSEMPVFLKKGQKQHTTEEANESRLVTKVRWIVESANGRIKQWKYLSNVLPNSQIPYIGDYTRIISSICNKYLPPLCSSEKENDELLAAKMLHLSKQKNELQAKVEESNLDKRSSVNWDPLEGDNSVQDFPVMSEEDLRNLTLGIYQIKQAKSYTREHFDSEGEYQIFLHKIEDGLLHIKLQSRHTSAKKYDLWIQYNDMNIIGWYCKCKAGARVVGMCSHIASVVWFLSNGRHQDNTKPNEKSWIDYIDDASHLPVDVIDDSSESSDSD